MKRALALTSILAILGASAPATSAGDREWATAGKVMAGIGAGLLLAKALEPEPVYVAPPVYVNPAPVVVQQPAVVVTQPQPAAVAQPSQGQTTTTTTTIQTQPVVIQQPVIVQPAPVIYQPAAVVYAAPVYVRPACPPPVYYAPGPVIGFHFSLGHHHHRVRW